MKHIALKAEKRTVEGKKVKQLRKQQILPANIFGKETKSLAVQVPMADFVTVYNEAGETGIIEVTVKGEKAPRNVLIHNVHIHPVSSKFLHADLHQVTMKEMIRVEIPITLIGEAPAIAKHVGILIQLMDTVEVEALPANLPEEIQVDLSSLAEVGDEIKLADIKIAGDFKIVEDLQRSIVRINPHEKEVEAPKPAEEAPAEGEEKPAEEGEKTDESKPAEEKKEEGKE
ncbi:MAG TPA: 50S ribosomal protein L25 [Patescibacteria group bacterium]|nr:50S ribosomal protein L25 [Patescibacteria group bacterium]